MRIFKYRTFDKWAKKQGLADDDLRKAIVEIEQGLIDANLGGNVYKKRIARQGQGKSGSYRTLLLMKQGDKVIFAHGFAKGEQDNITKNELDGFKIMATAFLNLTPEQLKHLSDNQSLIEISDE
jgi:hypothetical protein